MQVDRRPHRDHKHTHRLVNVVAGNLEGREGREENLMLVRVLRQPRKIGAACAASARESAGSVNTSILLIGGTSMRVRGRAWAGQRSARTVNNAHGHLDEDRACGRAGLYITHYLIAGE